MIPIARRIDDQRWRLVRSTVRGFTDR